MKDYQPFWFKEALQREGDPHTVTLSTDISTDLCIVGGGYTGLWSAVKIKEVCPELDITLIEAGLCGSGASGRNGGCMLTFSTKYPSMAKLFGAAEAKRLVSTSEEAVFEIAEYCKQHNIDCDMRIDGTFYTATNQAQQGSMESTIQQLSVAGINRWKQIPTADVQTLAGSKLHLEGHFSGAAGSLQPALLARGLRKRAIDLGIQIFENTPMKQLVEGLPAKVITPQGTITANKVVLATNAWMARQFKEFRRTIVLVSSDMVITQPIPDALKATGLTSGVAVVDSNTFVHYYRSTPDGRLMLGKGGNLFAFANKMLEAFDEESRFKPILYRAFRRFFPDISTDKIETTWTGASDRSVTGLPFFGFFRGHKNIVYGLGYSGNGVVQTYLGSEIIRSLILERQDEWSQSGLAKGPRGRFPIEPFRWIGAMLVRGAIRRKEAAEDNNQSPFWLDKQLAILAAAAGKADK